jgi:hypothetical protein
MIDGLTKLTLPGTWVLVALCLAPPHGMDMTPDARPSGNPQLAASPVWIEYTITGDAEVTAREDDVVMCSEIDDGFEVHTLGDWIFTLDTSGAEPGEHAAQFRVAAPASAASLHDNDARTDDRFEGEGTIEIESAGKDQFGLSLIEAKFSGLELRSEADHTISVSGTLGCQVL